MEGHCCTNYTSQRLLGYPDATGRWREYCAYQSVAKLLFLLEKESQVVPTSSGAMLHQSTVSLATLTFKPAYAILCGLLNITLLVPPPTQTQDYSPPGTCIALLCCCGLPRLVAMLGGHCSAAAGLVFKCSTKELLDLCCQFTPNSIPDIKSLVSYAAPATCTEPPDAGLFNGQWVPYVLTDRRSIAPAQRHQNQPQVRTLSSLRPLA